MERLTDEQWARVAPHIPKHKAGKKGGRPRVDDRGCFEGILWILRTGARWKDLPKAYPSPTTCWRRLNQWEREDVWLTLWRSFIAQLDQQGQIDWSESFMDGTFAPAKKGGSVLARHEKVRGQSSWFWSTARVFLSECTFRLPVQEKPRSRRQRSRSE